MPVSYGSQALVEDRARRRRRPSGRRARSTPSASRQSPNTSVISTSTRSSSTASKRQHGEAPTATPPRTGGASRVRRRAADGVVEPLQRPPVEAEAPVRRLAHEQEMRAGDVEHAVRGAAARRAVRAGSTVTAGLHPLECRRPRARESGHRRRPGTRSSASRRTRARRASPTGRTRPSRTRPARSAAAGRPRTTP